MLHNLFIENILPFKYYKRSELLKSESTSTSTTTPKSTISTTSSTISEEQTGKYLFFRLIFNILNYHYTIRYMNRI